MKLTIFALTILPAASFAVCRPPEIEQFFVQQGNGFLTDGAVSFTIPLPTSNYVSMTKESCERMAAERNGVCISIRRRALDCAGGMVLFQQPGALPHE